MASSIACGLAGRSDMVIAPSYFRANDPYTQCRGNAYFLHSESTPNQFAALGAVARQQRARQRTREPTPEVLLTPAAETQENFLTSFSVSIGAMRNPYLSQQNPPQCELVSAPKQQSLSPESSFIDSNDDSESGLVSLFKKKGGTAVVLERRNARERDRVKLVNKAFKKLQKHVPEYCTRKKRVSKLKILRAALNYIANLSDQLGLTYVANGAVVSAETSNMVQSHIDRACWSGLDAAQQVPAEVHAMAVADHSAHWQSGAYENLWSGYAGNSRGLALPTDAQSLHQFSASNIHGPWDEAVAELKT